MSGDLTGPAGVHLGHPIQVAARRAGLSAELLRAWERRYALVTPQRAGNGRRLYSASDIERLRLVRMASEAGRRVSELAKLTLPELEHLVTADALATHTQARDAATPLLEASLAAVSRLDDQALSALLRRAAIELSVSDFFEELITPLMREIGHRWCRGDLSPAHEHLATSVVSAVLLEITDTLQAGAAGPRLVVAAPAGQKHEIGCMIVAVAGLLEGCRVTYLGADLPALDVARVAKKVEAVAIALSVTIASSAEQTAACLQEVRRLFEAAGADLPILVGGQAVAGLAARLAKAGALPVPDLAALRQRLRALRPLSA